MLIADFYTCPMALRIKTLREARGLTQGMLAEMAGLSRSQLSEIETERKPANTLRLNAIAAALGVSVDALFEDGNREAYVSEILSLMRDMPEDDRQAIIRHAKALSKK